MPTEYDNHVWNEKLYFRDVVIDELSLVLFSTKRSQKVQECMHIYSSNFVSIIELCMATSFADIVMLLIPTLLKLNPNVML